MSDIALTHDHPTDHCFCPVSVPSRPSVSVGTITATSISLFWSVPSDSMVTSYEVMWREGATEITSGSLTTTSYTIQQLESNTSTNYTIIVLATNIAGSTESLPIIFYTGNAVACLPFFNIFSSHVGSNFASDSTRSGSVTDYIIAISGGVAVLGLTMAVTVTILVIMIVWRARRGVTAAQKRCAVKH